MGVTYIAPAGTVTSPAKLITKTITENNTYNAADDNANGYSSVTVNVEGGGGGGDLDNIFPFTANVTINVSGLSGLSSAHLFSFSEYCALAYYDEETEKYGLKGDFQFNNGELDCIFLSTLPLDYEPSLEVSTLVNWTVTVEGDAVESEGYIFIMGDCTINAVAE